MAFKLLWISVVMSAAFAAGCEWPPHKPVVNDKTETSTQAPATPPAADAPAAASPESSAPAPSKP